MRTHVLKKRVAPLARRRPNESGYEASDTDATSSTAWLGSNGQSRRHDVNGDRLFVEEKLNARASRDTPAALMRK
jgi:hypothetical protein